MRKHTANEYAPVLGIPGGGLTNATWAVNEEVAAIGQRGEEMTAALLNTIARIGGPTVMHDLRIPIPNITANIDHIVVSGKKVVIVDSKVWAPGFYWTLGGHTRRGLTRFPPADKRTVPMAVQSISRLLIGAGVKYRLSSLLVVWPSSKSGSLSLWAYRPQRHENGDMTRVVAVRANTIPVHRLFGSAPSDPDIVKALVPLLNKVGTGTGTSG